MEESSLTINLVIDPKVVNIPYTSVTYAEDVCIAVCKQLSIGTVARHLFGLRIPGKSLFLMPSARFQDKSTTYEFRIRYKVASITRLKKTDIKAYDYYFHQARKDVYENEVPDLTHEQYRKELIGLGISDMYRVMLEKDIPCNIVQKDYKKYIPKAAQKRHSLFIKKPVRKILRKIRKNGRDSWFVKAEYLEQLNRVAPEYLTEEYLAKTDKDGSIYDIIVKVSPFHPTKPGVTICYETAEREFQKKKKKCRTIPDWIHICTIEELCYISIRKDVTVEISRKNGIPFCLKFYSLLAMYSFVSVLDGYYRLMTKWTFNLCKDAPTPSLQKLYTLKCHGPVGSEFSYAKLEEKRENRPGCFIFRESEAEYNLYCLDVCMKNSLNPKTFTLLPSGAAEFLFVEDSRVYQNIAQLMGAYNDPQGAIFLQECLPSTEYDRSPLLLCQSDNISEDSLTDSSAVSNIIPTTPQCINSNDLQVYKDQKKEGTNGTTVVYRSMWGVTKGKKVEVSIKVLKHDDSNKNLREFLELAGKWSPLQSRSIVKLHGVTLINPVSMVMEHMPLGSLDKYLQDNKTNLKPVDLVEAASNLASALWYLEENGVVHGNIRCRKLLVHCHDEQTFTIKLTDPGLHNSYSSKEIHWIPVECYSNLEYAKRSTAADVWAFATTLWEIFTYGEPFKETDHNNVLRAYVSGKRLPQPSSCPNDIYHLMKECWNGDPHRRKQPQAVMRDISQILYQVYNSRRIHSYTKVLPNVASHSLAENTCTTQHEELMSVSELMEVDTDRSNNVAIEVTFERTWLLGDTQDSDNNENASSTGFSEIVSNLKKSTATSQSSLNSIESIFDLDNNISVILQGRIGQGFYGEVYRGMLEDANDVYREPTQVAVKKLKATATSFFCLQDFEREISIMKKLKHPNIVEILGVIHEPDLTLVMEFVPHGSLQSYLKIYRESLTNGQFLKYALDIANGMIYLGTKNIVHRDLAARNILVVDVTHVKISDFGLAQVTGTNGYYILKTMRQLPIKWYAPESMKYGKFSPRSDVWSYGVTLCEMFLHGEEPQLMIPDQDKMGFEQQLMLLDALENGERFPCPPTCPQSIYVRIIDQCWKADPHERPSFDQLLCEVQELLTQY